MQHTQIEIALAIKNFVLESQKQTVTDSNKAIEQYAASLAKVIVQARPTQAIIPPGTTLIGTVNGLVATFLVASPLTLELQ